MKRLLSLSLIIILVFSCFSGCSSGDSKEETEGQTTASIELTIENATKFLDIDVKADSSGAFIAFVSGRQEYYSYNDVNIMIKCTFNDYYDVIGFTELDIGGNGTITAKGDNNRSNWDYTGYEITSISGTITKDF